MVTLRSHPLMSYRGIPNWPPSWTSTCLKEKKTLKGEVGILKHVIKEDQLPTKCFLVMNTGTRPTWVALSLITLHSASRFMTCYNIITGVQ